MARTTQLRIRITDDLRAAGARRRIEVLDLACERVEISSIEI